MGLRLKFNLVLLVVFVLNDFHRPLFFGHRVAFISNHFNDFRAHRVFRVDPVSRFRGRTFAGIGVNGRRGFISTGVSRSERRIFNAPRTGRMPDNRSFDRTGRGISTGQPGRGSRSFSRPSLRAAPAIPGGGRTAVPSRGAGGSRGRGERR